MDKPQISKAYFKKLVGLRISSLFIEQNKTHKSLADYMGVKTPVISYICNGDRLPNIAQIYMIAEFFSVSADYLLGLTQLQTTEKTSVNIYEETGMTDGAINSILEIKKAKNGNCMGSLNKMLAKKGFSILISYINQMETSDTEEKSALYKMKALETFWQLLEQI